MNVHRNRIIVVNFILSILLAGASIAALILRIINNLTGINLEYFWPGCSQIYSTAKFSFAYKSIFIEFIANSAAVAFSLLAFMLLVCPFREVICSKSEEELVLTDKTGQIKVRNEALYFASSLAMLAWVVIVGKAVEYIFEGKNCTAIAAINNEIINYIDMAAGGLAFIFLCLTLALIAQREPQDQEIKLQNFRSEEAKKNEQEMAKKINQEVQGYLNSMEKQKEDTKQGLLKYQRQVFGQSPSYLNQEYNETIIKDQPFNYKQRYTNPQKQSEAEGESQYSYQYVVASDQEGKEGFESKNNFGMNFEPSSNQNGVIVEEQNQDLSLQGPPVSLKGGPSNQAQSPTIKGANAARDASPTLRGRNSKAAQSPSISRMTQDSSKPIALKKIEVMKKTTSNIVDDPKDPQSQIKQKEQEQEKPRMQKSGEFITEEIQKLLQVTLYNNFRVQKESLIPEHRDHCPILKYVQKDQHYEINQTDYNFKGKSKKNNYEKEQLIFCRKRKEQLPSKKQFDETATIKRERSQIFGQKWSKEREREEQERARQMSTRFKKRNGLEAIRSKYCI